MRVRRQRAGEVGADRQLRFTGGREAPACNANHAHRSLRAMTSLGGSENSRSKTAVKTAHCTIHVLTPMRFSILGSPVRRGVTSKRGHYRAYALG